MRDLLLLLHLTGAIFWLGGMAFMLFVLRPAAHARLEPPVRLPLIVQVLRRFFAGVGISIALLLASGALLLMQVPARSAPLGWHAMSGLGVAMVLVFGHIVFAPWRRLKAAVAAADWPLGGRQMNQIARLVQLNLALGWTAIAAVLLWR